MPRGERRAHRTAAALTPGTQVRVRLLKAGILKLEYPAVAVFDDGVHVVVRGPWADATARDLGFAVFEPGDIFTEHYWRDRWYSVKEVRRSSGEVKGWYCDVARPAHIDGTVVVSEDLDLDLWVSADGTTVLRLDEDEFEASGLVDADPVAAAAAYHALGELEELAADRFAAVSVSEPSR